MTAPQARADAAGLVGWRVGVNSTILRAHQHAAGARRRPQARTHPGGVEHELADREPADHALAPSCGGLTTKLHLACEPGPRPLAVVVVSAGQRGDSPQFVAVLAAIRVPPARRRPAAYSA